MGNLVCEGMDPQTAKKNVTYANTDIECVITIKIHDLQIYY